MDDGHIGNGRASASAQGPKANPLEWAGFQRCGVRKRPCGLADRYLFG